MTPSDTPPCSLAVTPPCVHAASQTLSQDAMIAIAKALGDPRRYGILGEIASSDGPLACCDMKAGKTVSAPTITHHIQTLAAAGLIEVTYRGKFASLRFCRDRFDAYVRQLSRDLIPAPPPQA